MRRSYETYNGASVYTDTKLLLKPGGVQRVLGLVHQVHHSSNQGEPEWLLFRLFEKFKQFDTLKSSTEWRGPEVWEAGFRNMLRTATTGHAGRHGGADSDQDKGGGRVSGHFTPEAGCVTCCQVSSESLSSGLGRKK